MRKLLVFFFSISLTSALIALSPCPVFAFHQKQVLGDSATPESLSIPPTAEGPGFILPDSPFFFLDKIKQEVRLVLAFTPEKKAKVHAAVAGERLAELQFMLAKNHDKGIKTALEGVSDNLKKAADDISTAKLGGKDITLAAKATNDSIREKQKKLFILESKASGEIKSRVQMTREAIKAAKVEVEDALPEDLIFNEIEDDLNQEIDEHIEKARNSATKIDHSIDVLNHLATQAAEKEQMHREKALRHAIEVKNETLRKQELRRLEERKIKHDRLMKAKEKAMMEARKAAMGTEEAAKQFKEAQESIVEIKSDETANSEFSESSDSPALNNTSIENTK